MRFEAFPYCCGAGVLAGFYKAPPSLVPQRGWNKPGDVDTWLEKAVGDYRGLAFLLIVLNYEEYSQPGLEDTILKHGFEKVGEAVNYSERPLRLYLRQKNFKKVREHDE